MRRLATATLTLLAVPALAQEPPPAAPIEVVPPAPAAPAAPPAATAAPTTHWYDDIVIDGFISFTLSVSFNDPKSAEGDTLGKNQYRSFDVFANTMSLDVAELTVRRDAQGPGDLGMRIDIATGQTIPRFAAANGSSAGPFDLQQAYLSYNVAVGNGLKLDLGKFVTPAGIEVIEGYDGYNDLYSHSFLFTFGPFTHTGFKLSYPFSPMVTAAFYGLNGWDVLIDNNREFSLGGQLSITPPGDVLSLQLLYLGGAELPDPDPPWRHFLDIVAQIKASKTVGLGVHFDFAKEGDTSWYGAAGYATIFPGAAQQLAFRAEVFADPDGAKTGVMGGQTLFEATATGTLRFSPHNVLRLELRLDHSSKDVFVTNDSLSDNQITLAANYLGMF
jgi:hypothetical protein